ncbi:bifunctional hydroxymethylpyrimidine kinase/phosphomethylpyrimidine kinase [Sulfobacillus sp. hq2]|uniref:bifunctional hydroxymethylpyrimidine kinase/phosphomethylpyrimidine kinase n=1 Tax=Sulfobacillus sp. hq2 TaxID=2039167 RepID=UPI000CD00FCA|nr:bifunctional hydroxymethylpyrimidine kinase/phosphomethylpyrimidine kinase [Sulfobacillus sp. hq2]POB09527.1 bifunctional hydroxymethylpyrimidine kinase/phosphomethylpyrimidine kinase [Sulfobacillus sp. hq2]
MMARALTIAGSDSGGGAGIQADLKTFMAFSVFGMSAITAITVQNTVGVERVQALDPEVVGAQIDAVTRDLGTDAIKIGMLFSKPIIEVVAERLRQWPGIPVVLDPVMRAKGGAPLLDPGAEKALRDVLLPLATVVTPNLPEASALVGFPVQTRADMQKAAHVLENLGVPFVLIKGGHLADEEAVDLLLHEGRETWLSAPRIETLHTHGTGCTLSSAIAAGLARHDNIEQAISTAKEYVTQAIRHAPGLGHGHGPLLHHWGQSPWI